MTDDTVVPRTLNALDERIAALERELDQGAGSDDGESSLLDGSDSPDASETPAEGRVRAADRSTQPSGLHKRRKVGEGGQGAGEEGSTEVITSLYCNICCVSVNSAALMREHRQGKRHRETEMARAAAAEGRWCATCRLAFTSTAQLREHEEGKRHKEAVVRAAPGRGRGRGVSAAETADVKREQGRGRGHSRGRGHGAQRGRGHGGRGPSAAGTTF